MTPMLEGQIVEPARPTGYVRHRDSRGSVPKKTTFVSYVSTGDAETTFDQLYEPPEAVIRTPEEVKSALALNQDLGELCELVPGWLDGEGEAIARPAIEKAKRILGDLLTDTTPYPVIVPTPEGGVQAEWSSRDYESSITFEPDGAVHMFAMNMTNHEVIRTLLEPGHPQSEPVQA